MDAKNLPQKKQCVVSQMSPDERKFFEKLFFTGELSGLEWNIDPVKRVLFTPEKLRSTQFTNTT